MNRKPIAATDIFLAILALMLVSVSFYQTWLGLEQIFGYGFVHHCAGAVAAAAVSVLDDTGC